ncbi:hypothetical protein R3P38DRAFT_3294858 [Favolaschia claudopus]|uniref:Uncharacterized protein n=1 Tax=Favolaschia claudopus TaxID=2862362 RepID=A0AAV9ZC03_9AGAR
MCRIRLQSLPPPLLALTYTRLLMMWRLTARPSSSKPYLYREQSPPPPSYRLKTRPSLTLSSCFDVEHVATSSRMLYPTTDSPYPSAPLRRCRPTHSSSDSRLFYPPQRTHRRSCCAGKHCHAYRGFSSTDHTFQSDTPQPPPSFRLSEFSSLMPFIKLGIHLTMPICYANFFSSGF